MGRTPRQLPETDAAPHLAAQAEDLLLAVEQILLPLVQLLIAAGVDYPRFAGVLKTLFVAQAQRTLHASGQKDTDSAVSVLSGVHRKDVKTWRTKGLNKRAERGPSIASQTFARWSHDPAYRDRSRRPRKLPRSGPEPSFETLARSVTQDVHPFTLLNELHRLGLVRVDTVQGRDMVIPNPDGFVPAAGSAELLALFGANLADHSAAAASNLLGRPPHLEQSVFAEGLTEESAQQLAVLARTLWAKARSDMIAAATELYASDKGRDDATHRMRFGAYFWDEETQQTAPQRADPGDIDNESS